MLLNKVYKLKTLAKIRKMRFYARIVIPLIVFLIIFLIAITFYHNIEGWRYLDSAYFCTATVTTIGYGDITPQTDAGKIFTIVFAFMGIGIAFYFFTLVGRYFAIKAADKINGGRINKGIIKVK